MRIRRLFHNSTVKSFVFDKNYLIKLKIWPNILWKLNRIVETNLFHVVHNIFELLKYSNEILEYVTFCLIHLVHFNFYEKEQFEPSLIKVIFLQFFFDLLKALIQFFFCQWKSKMNKKCIIVFILDGNLCCIGMKENRSFW